MRDFQPVIEQCVARFREGSDAVRLFHGRGHSYPGYEDLTVDLFPPCLVVRSYGDDEPGVMKLAGLLSERLAGLQGSDDMGDRQHCIAARLEVFEMRFELLQRHVGGRYVRFAEAVILQNNGRISSHSPHRQIK